MSNELSITFRLLYAMLFTFFASYTEARTIKKAYLDNRKNVHLIAAQGRHHQVTQRGNATSLKIAAGNETVAWLVANARTAKGDDKGGSEELVIYRDGKQASIKCGPFIRDYWFWKDGSQVAIDCGGRRFAGREILYDTRTLKELSSFDQAAAPLKDRPDWSNGND